MSLAESTNMSSTSQPRPAIKTDSVEKPVHLLVVDDEVLITWTLKAILEDAFSCVVHTATNGQEALRRLKASPPIDLMITDYKMPGMDGLALAKVVQQQFPQTVVVMLTAYISSNLPQQADEASIWRVLNKPAKLMEIRRVVSEILQELI